MINIQIGRLNYVMPAIPFCDNGILLDLLALIRRSKQIVSRPTFAS